jgi:limonene-1,2-epoxide hydrolase
MQPALSGPLAALLEKSSRADGERDADLFATILAPEAELQLGPFPAIRGREAIRKFIAGFFATVGHLDQRLVRAWEHPGGLAYESEVTYTLLNGSKIAPIPYCNVWDVAGGLITRYRIYIDLTPLKEATAAH